MPTNFPGSLDTLANPTATNTMDGVPHHTQHASANDAIEAIEAKLGTGASTAVSGRVLTGTGTGTSAWSVPFTDPLESVVFNATGGDDAAPLRTLLATLTEGTTIYMPDPLYSFSTVNAANVCVEIAISNIYFVGRGRERLDSGDPTGHTYTTIVKCQVTGATLFRWRPPQASSVNGPDQVDQVQGGGIAHMSVAGQANAATCIDVTGGCRGQKFTDLWIGGATSRAVAGTAGASHSGTSHTWHSSSEIIFRECTIRGTGAAHGVVTSGNSNANGGECCYNWGFYDCIFITTDGTGWQHNDGDDNFADNCGFVVTGTGHSFDLTGSSGKPHARAEFFKGCWGADFMTTGIVRATGLTKASRSHLIIGGGTEDATGLMSPTIEPGASLRYLDDWGRHTFRPDLRTSSCLTDDFNGGLLTDGLIGETNWHIFGTGATLAYVSALANHSGVRQLGNGAGANVLCGIMQSGGVNTGLSPASGFESSFIFRLNAAGSDGDVMCRVGWGNGPTADPPNDGFWLEKLVGDTTWWFVCSGGVKTRVDSGATVTNGGWVRLRIRRRNDTQIGLSTTDIVDGNDNAVISTHVPTVALSAFFHIKNATAVAKNMDIDAFQVQTIGLIR